MTEYYDETVERPTWSGLSVDRLRASDVQALLGGEAAYVHVPRYLSPKWCAEILRRVRAGAAEARDYGVSKTRQLGLALGPMFARRKAYFSRAAELNAALREVYSGGDDPLAKVLDDFRRCTGWTSVDAREDGAQYATDMVGELLAGSGIPLHCHSPGELPGLFISRFPKQLSWNVYLAAPEEGGALVIYRRRRGASDEDFGAPGQGYTGALARGAASITFQPRCGDFVIFDSDYYHEVLPFPEAQHRAAAHSFFSVDAARREFCSWS